MCDTSTACQSVGILPETLNKFVRAGWFEMPTTRQDNWLVWSEHDQERLKALVAQGRNPSPNPLPQIDTAPNTQVRFSIPSPEPKLKTERAPKPEPKPKRVHKPKPKPKHLGTTLSYQGIEYRSITALARHLGMPQRTLSGMLARHAYNADEALNAPLRKTGPLERLYPFHGEQLTARQLATRYRMTFSAVTWRLQRHNYDAEHAFADKLQQHH